MACRIAVRIAVTAFAVGAAACRPPAMPTGIPPQAPAPVDALTGADALDLGDDGGDGDDPLANLPRPPGQEPKCAEPPAAPKIEADFGLARTQIDNLLRWSGTPSIAVAVAHHGEIVWEQGFGLADKRRRVRATPHTAYSLASISKPITATGLMVLVQRKKIDLARPLNDYLGEPGIRTGAGDAANATVQRVANHTAGLPLHYQFYYADRPPKVPPYAETQRRYAVTITAPGERYHYSNLGFGLIEQAIAEVSGLPYAEFMAKEVFAPLGLAHTAVDRPRSGKVAVRYDGRGRPIPDYRFDHDGASAVYSSAHDLVRFGMLHIGDPVPGQTAILDVEHRKRMLELLAPSERYGIGMGVYRVDGKTAIGHGGGMPGVRTVLRVFPQQKVAIVVLANSSTVGNQLREVLWLVEHALGLPARADTVCGLRAGHPLVRTWQGTVETIGGPKPLRLTIAGTGEIGATIGSGPEQIVRNIEFKDEHLGGTFVGDLGAELGRGKPSLLELDLRLRGDVLSGGVRVRVPHVATTTLYTALRPSS